MSAARREELAALAIAGELTDAERAEFEAALRADPEFAREVEALRDTDSELAGLARPLVQHPEFTLGESALDEIRAAAAARKGRAWFFAPWFVGTGLAAAAALALVLIFSGPRGDVSVERGAVLLARLQSQADVTRIGVWAKDRATVKACLWLDEAAWARLPSADRAALIAHLRAQVPAIRANPARYAATAGGGQPAADVERAIPNLRDGDWLVMTMAREGTGWVRRGIVAESS
jgi:anti-sigma factor RsiW